MKVTLRGTRGSMAAPGPETAGYGGNTACAEVRAEDGTPLILDAGTGVRRVQNGGDGSGRIDVLLSHLHLDHIQGLGFFEPLYDPRMEVHVWGPGGLGLDLRTRLSRYLSPPLFPVHLGSLPCRLALHEVPDDPFRIGPYAVWADYVNHPGPTVGYRIEADGAVLTYLPDHEPALGVPDFPDAAEWTSGYALAEGADLLVHDSQYLDEDYPDHLGWGHSSVSQVIAFGRLAEARRLVLFHHDPRYTDAILDEVSSATATTDGMEVLVGREEATYEV